MTCSHTQDQTVLHCRYKCLRAGCKAVWCSSSRDPRADMTDTNSRPHSMRVELSAGCMTRGIQGMVTLRGKGIGEGSDLAGLGFSRLRRRIRDHGQGSRCCNGLMVGILPFRCPNSSRSNASSSTELGQDRARDAQVHARGSSWGIELSTRGRQPRVPVCTT